jgi:hypothetical protein
LCVQLRKEILQKGIKGHRGALRWARYSARGNRACKHGFAVSGYSLVEYQRPSAIQLCLDDIVEEKRARVPETRGTLAAVAGGSTGFGRIQRSIIAIICGV